MLWTPQSKPAPGAQIDWWHPLARTVRGYWLCNEGGGRLLNDLCGMSPALGLPAWGGGPGGTALKLAGVNNTAPECANRPSLNITGPLTIAARVMPDSFVTSAYILARNLAAPTTSMQYGLYASAGTGDVTPVIENAVWSPSKNLTRGKLVSVVFSYDGVSLWSLYFDGKVVATQVSAKTITSQNYPLLIGGRSNAGTGNVYSWNGLIDYAAVFASALLPSEVAWLAAEPYSMIADPSPRRYFIFKSEEAASTSWIGGGFW